MAKKKRASLTADLAAALDSAEVKGPVVLFPNGLPSPKHGKYAAFSGEEVIAQGDRIEEVEKKAAEKGKGAAVVVDVSFDYSQQCFF